MNTVFMKEALLLARQAAENGEIPVGAVIVKDNEIIAQGKNGREKKKDVFSHAECEAIKEAREKLGDWRLSGCSMYVTLEPCMMCMGAIINSRIDELCFAAYDLSQGAAESAVDIKKLKGFKPQIFGGVCEKEAAGIMEDFFKNLRK